MSEYKRPLPQMNEYNQAFWHGAKEGVFRVQRCRKCGGFQWYPRPSCTKCGSLDLEWIDSKGLGTVYSYTIIRRVVANSPDFQKDIPFVVAEIDLDEGVRVYGRVDEVNPEEVRPGMRVKAVFFHATADIFLYKFVPVR